jgi:hypothetical protein
VPESKYNFDPDRDPDPTGELDKLQREQIDRTRHYVNTSPDALQRERERAEELEHERAKAEIRVGVATVPAVPAHKKKPASRSDKRQEMISRAASEAGENNKLFCEFLDREGVPVRSQYGVRDWRAAWEKEELRSAIRSFKRRNK